MVTSQWQGNCFHFITPGMISWEEHYLHSLPVLYRVNHYGMSMSKLHCVGRSIASALHMTRLKLHTTLIIHEMLRRQGNTTQQKHKATQHNSCPKAVRKISCLGWHRTCKDTCEDARFVGITNVVVHALTAITLALHTFGCNGG